MKCLKSYDLTRGWQAHYFNTGEVIVNNTDIGKVLRMPRDSVNALIKIIDEIKQEKETSS
jgi:hypothetical protein